MNLFKSIIETLFWTLVALVVVVLVMLMFGWGTAPVASYLAALAIIALFPLSVRMVSLTRRRRGDAVITYLEQAVRLNLPLTRMIDAAQRSEEGALALRLAALSRQLHAGRTLAAAIEIAVPEVSSASTSAIDVG